MMHGQLRNALRFLLCSDLGRVYLGILAFGTGLAVLLSGEQLIVWPIAFVVLVVVYLLYLLYVGSVPDMDN